MQAWAESGRQAGRRAGAGPWTPRPPAHPSRLDHNQAGIVVDAQHRLEKAAPAWRRKARVGWGVGAGVPTPRPPRPPTHHPTPPPTARTQGLLEDDVGHLSHQVDGGRGARGRGKVVAHCPRCGWGGEGVGGGGGGGADTGRGEGVGVGGSGAWVQGWTGRGAAAGGQRSKRSVVAIARSCPALRRPAWGDGWWWRTICARGCANPQGRSAGRAWHARPAALGPTLRRAAPAVLHTPSAPARAEWRPNPRPTPPCVAPHAHLRPAPPSAPHHGRRQR